MKYPICVDCEVEVMPEEIGVVVAEMFLNNTKIYKLWNADLLKCPMCGRKIVDGFGAEPFAIHNVHDCEKIVEQQKAKGIQVIRLLEPGTKRQK